MQEASKVRAYPYLRLTCDATAVHVLTYYLPRSNFARLVCQRAARARLGAHLAAKDMQSVVEFSSGPSDDCMLGSHGACPMACWWCDDLQLCVAEWEECLPGDHASSGEPSGGSTVLLVAGGLLLCLCAVLYARARGGPPSSRHRHASRTAPLGDEQVGPLWVPDHLLSVGSSAGCMGESIWVPGDSEPPGATTYQPDDIWRPERSGRVGCGSTCVPSRESSQPEGQRLLS